LIDGQGNTLRLLNLILADSNDNAVQVVNSPDFNAISTLFQRYFNAISKLFQRYFNAISTLFQRYFNAISTLFQRHLNAISTPFERHLNVILTWCRWSTVRNAWLRTVRSSRRGLAGWRSRAREPMRLSSTPLYTGARCMEFRLSTRVRLFLLTFALRFSAFLTDSLTVSHVFFLGCIDLIDCELSSNHKSGISCNDLGSFVKAESSVISTNDDAAVDIDYAATVKVHDCVLHGNDMFGVRVNGERSEVFLTNNEIHENEIGIWGWRGAVINVAENSITHNFRSDFEIEVRFCLCLPVCAHVALLCFVCVLYRGTKAVPPLAGLPDAGLLN
jgi:hypothetical protein